MINSFFIFVTLLLTLSGSNDRAFDKSLRCCKTALLGRRRSVTVWLVQTQVSHASRSQAGRLMVEFTGKQMKRICRCAEASGQLIARRQTIIRPNLWN
jgi:hypothetical protein